MTNDESDKRYSIKSNEKRTVFFGGHNYKLEMEFINENKDPGTPLHEGTFLGESKSLTFTISSEESVNCRTKNHSELR